MSLKPIKLFMHSRGPNPWKVAIVLEELGLPWEPEFVDMSKIKTPAFEKYNPNGRVPAIIDPNKNDFVLWESGAIIEYIVENYDTQHKISFDSFEEKYLAKQYLYFQVSGQGPYFGQAGWFMLFHPEKVPSAVERYVNEIKRITKVLDGVLEGKDYLVGNKVSYADLSFITWYWTAKAVIPELSAEAAEKYPNFKRWDDALNARAAVKKCLKGRDDAVAREEAQKQAS